MRPSAKTRDAQLFAAATLAACGPRGVHHAAKRAVYDVIRLRRDVRHFRVGAEVAPETLRRILDAAHSAPSVGLSQPCGFVLVRDAAVRGRIRERFLRARAIEADRYDPLRRSACLAHRLEGILEAALNVRVPVDLRERGEAVLGATLQPETLRASACCAVQKLGACGARSTRRCTRTACGATAALLHPWSGEIVGVFVAQPDHERSHQRRAMCRGVLPRARHVTCFARPIDAMRWAPEPHSFGRFGSVECDAPRTRVPGSHSTTTMTKSARRVTIDHLTLRLPQRVETMNKPAIGQLRAAVRFAVASMVIVAAVGCSRTSSTVPVHEARADAQVPLVEDAGASAREAGVRDAAIAPRTSVDAAVRAPTIDAEAYLCAGTICVAPARCDTSSGFAHCACPAGMEFVDLGGDHSPCQPIPPVVSSDDGGDAADGG